MGKHQGLKLGLEDRLRRAARLLAGAALRRATEREALPGEDAALLTGIGSTVGEAPRQPE